MTPAREHNLHGYEDDDPCKKPEPEPMIVQVEHCNRAPGEDKCWEKVLHHAIKHLLIGARVAGHAASQRPHEARDEKVIVLSQELSESLVRKLGHHVGSHALFDECLDASGCPAGKRDEPERAEDE